MRKLSIGIIDLISKRPTRTLWARLMHANLASIMPQVTAVWCEEEGHNVKLVCYTGLENMEEELQEDVHLVFIGAFTEHAHLAYALSNRFRSKNVVTVLGGPHARSYPQDAQQYFDYVLGFTDKSVIRDVLIDCSQHRPIGLHLTATQQPATLPGVQERWKFIEQTLQKAPFIKIIPMLGSLGCPYTCGFCVDSVVPYQQLDLDQIKEDLRFLLRKVKRPRVGWHDPNFGFRFNDYMNAIEESIPPKSIDFIAESSLSLLSEPRLKRLRQNGFKALLPGIESWYDMGNKSNTGKTKGIEKVKQVSEQVNTILRYIPYIQTNFILGLDVDKGPEPFELTKRFIDMSPGAFPSFPMLTVYGETPPFNIEYQRSNRILPFPFHFLNNNQAMNMKPKNYSWPDFYDHVIDLHRYSFSWRAIYSRHRATKVMIPRWVNLVRAVSTEGFGRVRYYSEIRRRLDADPQFRPYFNQETTKLPQFYLNMVQKDLGPLWEWLPEGAVNHDPYVYLKEESG